MGGGRGGRGECMGVTLNLSPKTPKPQSAALALSTMPLILPKSGLPEPLFSSCAGRPAGARARKLGRPGLGCRVVGRGE